jgi:platelet-activating factor acetylhydrolase
MEFSGQFAVGICDIECNVLFRLYYPTSTISSSPWTEKPFIYSHGLMRYLRLPILTPLAALILWNKTIPCHKDAEPLQGQFPLIIFSHGLHGNRLTYSHLCGELASHGFIVAAIEHRDRSASVAALKGHASHVFYEMPPSMDDDFHLDYRRKQLDIRFQEVKHTLEAIQELNEGCPIQNDMPCQLNLEIFKNKIRLDEMTLMGHSFGVIETMIHYWVGSNHIGSLAETSSIQMWNFARPMDVACAHYSHSRPFAMYPE